MSNTNYTELVLTCSSWQEAQLIADSLLDKHLIACAEFMEIKSKYHWEGGLEESKEIKLIMKSIANNFEKVEAEIAKIHSYKTFVLQSLPISHTSKAAQAWLSEVIS